MCIISSRILRASSGLFISISDTALLFIKALLLGLNFKALSSSLMASSGFPRFRRPTALLFNAFSESDFNLKAASNVITLSLLNPHSN